MSRVYSLCWIKGKKGDSSLWKQDRLNELGKAARLKQDRLNELGKGVKRLHFLPLLVSHFYPLPQAPTDWMDSLVTSFPFFSLTILAWTVKLFVSLLCPSLSSSSFIALFVFLFLFLQRQGKAAELNHLSFPVESSIHIRSCKLIHWTSFPRVELF